ncbi:flagellar brake protein [Jeotgalibacillus sp. R-1-5s-1]|uniref:flagellar brake protein n=1 Tax=Jeotgalibacillus sp. R-1-5s-1 TaxID=2555897 RepID=UPI00106CB2EF|nr:flagellar brake domain-containing protein [Jeotgalibacillus sp. R-1-5s-1]TFE00426.1 pilus assembly protein PilZ [Jeotgalibacillus sp. R-1-5s-1]
MFPLKIGTVITIEPMHAASGEKFRGRVLDLKGDKLFIDYPVNTQTDRTVFLLTGMQLKVSFTDDKNEVFSFETEVRGRVQGNIPMITLKKPEESDLIKVQRRQFVRVKTSIDVAIRTEGSSYNTVTDDVSAGGLSFIIRQGYAFSKGQELDMMLVLPMKNGENQYIRCQTTYIRSKSVNGVEIGMVKFSGITTIERQLLLRYTFECQLRMKEKQL